MFETLQDYSVGIPLPDDVEPAHAQVNRFASLDLEREVHQNTISQIAGIIQANHRHANFQYAAEIFEYAFAVKTAHGIFADRIWRVGFNRTTLCHWNQPVNVARRESHDSAAAKSLANQGGQMCVHGP